jgi:alkylhydroperoxidase/carboxymuconolactone decarboxylase family protein YurZ
MSTKPPKAFRDFTARYPRLGDAWDAVRQAEVEGPLGEKMRRLVKLGIAVGAMRQGAVSSAARKARAAGASDDEVYQVIALAASTLGFPSAVAVFTWIDQRRTP